MYVKAAKEIKPNTKFNMRLKHACSEATQWFEGLRQAIYFIG